MRINITKMALSLVAGFGLMAGSALAQITTDIDANVPFSFVVGNKTLPAGKYVIHPVDPGQLEFSDASGKAVVIWNTEAAQMNSEPKDTELLFNRYGNRDFLNKIFLSGDPYGVELERSKEERQLIASGQKATEHRHPAKVHNATPKVS